MDTIPPATGAGELCGKIISRLRPLANGRKITFGRRDLLSCINDWSSKLAVTPPSSDEYAQFVRDVHDLLVKLDSPLRAMLLRALRLSITSKEHCLCLVEEEVHWIIVTCMEREQEFLVERMQALKLMKKFLSCAGDVFPPAFARSLVAVATQKDDSLRRVCMEVLRQLAVENPRCAVSVNGLSTLLEAVLDPNFQDMSESILISFMYLLNDPKTRKFIRPYLDLHLVLAPFTDLDSEPAEQAARWKAAKNAFVILMRSWTGVIQLTSDELGLPTLVRLLRDSKVHSKAQGAILDAIAEVFEPVSSKIKKVRGAHKPHVRPPGLDTPLSHGHASTASLNSRLITHPFISHT